MTTAKNIDIKAPIYSGNLAPNVCASNPTSKTPNVVPAVKQER